MDSPLYSRRPTRRNSESAYRLASSRYADWGVNTAAALKVLAGIQVSLQCWQGDDVVGFENRETSLGGGLAVTGNHPGRARNAEELRADLQLALSLIPGRHRVNLHAMYGEFGGQKIDRTEVDPTHFHAWLQWAQALGFGLDFNPTCFAHPQATSGLTLSHPDLAIRQFWIAHCAACRRIASVWGAALGTPVVSNLWIPDGFKDTPVDRKGPRERLLESLDAVFQRRYPDTTLLDSVESKLFGIGAESCTVGSHEFYLGYAITRKKLLCLDSGHFHPTETISDKISAVLPFIPGLLLHVSRGVRWDSDHVVTLSDDLIAIAREIVSNGYLKRVHLGLDYFDASINRIAAWVIGSRSLLKALLLALLEPPGLREAERAGDNTSRLALQEEAKALPFGLIWDHYCESHGVPSGDSWLPAVKRYEREALLNR